MTKRDFDGATKHNHGGAYGSRTEYRASRGQAAGTDRVAARASEMARRNEPYRVLLDGRLATLGSGSRFRSLAAYRASQGIPLL